MNQAAIDKLSGDTGATGGGSGPFRPLVAFGLFFLNLVLGSGMYVAITAARSDGPISASEIDIDTAMYATVLSGVSTILASIALKGGLSNWAQAVALVRPASGWLRGMAWVLPAYITALLLIGLATMAAEQLGVDASDRQDVVDAVDSSSGVPWVLVVVIGVYAPLFEEILYRGIMLRSLVASPRLHVVVSVLISSVIFGLVHDSNLARIQISVLAVVLSYLAIKQRSIWPSILLHAIFNGVAVTGLLIT